MASLDALLAERDALLVGIERNLHRYRMPFSLRLLKQVEREIRAIDPSALPGPVRWEELPGIKVGSEDQDGE